MTSHDSFYSLNLRRDFCPFLPSFQFLVKKLIPGTRCSTFLGFLGLFLWGSTLSLVFLSFPLNSPAPTRGSKGGVKSPPSGDCIICFALVQNSFYFFLPNKLSDEPLQFSAGNTDPPFSPRSYAPPLIRDVSAFFFSALPTPQTLFLNVTNKLSVTVLLFSASLLSFLPLNLFSPPPFFLSIPLFSQISLLKLSFAART